MLAWLTLRKALARPKAEGGWTKYTLPAVNFAASLETPQVLTRMIQLDLPAQICVRYSVIVSRADMLLSTTVTCCSM